METNKIQNSKQNGVSFKLVIIYVGFIALLFGIQSIYGQKAIKFDDYLEGLKNQKSLNGKSKAESMKSLAFDHQPTFYVRDNQIITIDSKAPICGDIELSDIHLLNSRNSKFENVEFLTIRLRSEISRASKLNLNQLSHFKNLKFIHVICEYSCVPTSIEQIFEGENSKLQIFYSISIPN
jgi:hypothetical protein